MEDGTYELRAVHIEWCDWGKWRKVRFNAKGQIAVDKRVVSVVGQVELRPYSTSAFIGWGGEGPGDIGRYAGWEKPGILVTREELDEIEKKAMHRGERVLNNDRIFFIEERKADVVRCVNKTFFVCTSQCPED
jgi:hypothetical protein